ncbi:MAG: trimethylamine methyltransferase family protein [Primorskyibacter sp.]
MDTPTRARGGRRRKMADRANTEAPAREVNYRKLRNPFPVMSAVSDDELANIHTTALRTLEELGIRVLLPEARQLFKAGGARVDEASQMVWIGREMVDAAVATAPKSYEIKAGDTKRDLLFELGSMVWQPGGGAPHATDLVRGRRPGSLQDFREFTQIVQALDAIHMISAMTEPQDVPTHLRHYAFAEAQLTLSDKVPFVFARGTPQTLDSFEMISTIRGLSEDDFRAQPWTYTVINTNSPRQLDIPMSQGLIDFARWNQPSVITPFTLMGAMAPITPVGAMMLSHAEALAALTLTQLANAGAPVMYGTFTSNVDMKSGAPAFGTPEHFKASLIAGQLARMLGLPWRCASGSAANINDAQAANENQFAMWGCMLAGATLTIHAAGWLEGGLTVSFEKLITDTEVLNMMADMCRPTMASEADIAFEALREVDPGGHFFGCAHTMERYETEFYTPLVADWSNFGTWTERGSKDASTRATAMWQQIVAEDKRPAVDPERIDSLNAFIRRRTSEGGAPPES